MWWFWLSGQLRAATRTEVAESTSRTVTDVPADAVGRQNLLFRERAYDLYLTSHRLGDLRRLIRQYGRNAETVFPTGVYNPLGAAAGNSYGPDVNLPIPFEETNNPQYKACIDRNP